MLALANKLSLNTRPIYRFVNEHSVDFDGVDDRIITDGADTVAQPTTYSFWCKSSETGQNQGVFGHGNTNVGAFHFNAFGGNRPILYLENNYYRYWTDTPAQDDGEWHHWVVYSDTNDITNSKLYVDGVLQTVDATVSSGSTNAYTESLTIGSDQASGGNSFVGKIDEFAVYDRELTQAEITRMFNTYYSPNRIANGNFAQEGVEEVTNGDFSQIGSELLTNGDFSSASGWSGSISVAGGQGTKTGGGLAYQTGVITSGKQYKIVVDVASLDGATNIYTGGNSSAALTVGLQTIYMTGGSSNDFLGLNNGYSTGVGTVFNSISVKEVGIDWTLQSSWSVANGKANYDAVTTQHYLKQTMSSIAVGKTVKIQFDISDVEAGKNAFFKLECSGDPETIFAYTTFSEGTYTYYHTITTAFDRLNFVPLNTSTGGSFSIDNISVKEVLQNWTVADYGGVAASASLSLDNGAVKILKTADSDWRSSFLRQTISYNIGASYRVSFKIKDGNTTGANIYVRHNYDTSSQTIASGISLTSSFVQYTYDFVADSNSTDISFGNVSWNSAGSGEYFFVDNIVVQELKHDATNLMLNAGAYQSANPLITSTKSMEFDGVDDRLKANSTLGSFTGSISFWFNRNTNSASAYLFDSRGASSGGTGYALFSGTDLSATVSSGTIYVNGVAGSVNMSLNVWNNIVITGMTLNINEDISIGSRHNGINFFDGKMTEVGLWDRTLTALEVASLYNQGVPTDLLVNRGDYVATNLVGYWKMGDGTNDEYPVIYDQTNPTLGSELVTNGDFASNITGWSAKDCTIVWDNGKLKADNSSGNANGGAFQNIGLVTGKQYKMTVTMQLLTGSSNGTFNLFTSSATGTGQSSVYTGSTLVVGGAAVTETFYFTPASGDVSIQFTCDEANATYTIDNITVKEVQGNPATMTNMLEGNITNQYPLTKIRNYYRMGDGILDGYPLIADQTNPSLGIELVTNGDFLLNPINANSWFESFYPGGDVLAGSTWSWDSNTYIVTGGIQQGGSNSESQLQQTVTATVGRTYKFEAYVKSTNNKARLHAYTGSPGGSYPGSSFHSGSGDWELLSICFVATGNAGSTTTVTLRLQLNAVTSGTETYNAEFKNATFKEVGGNPGYMTNMSASDIVLDTPNKPN